MLYMLMICYDPTIEPVESERNLQPEHHKLELELRERGSYVSGAGLWPLEAAKNVRQQAGRRSVTDGPFAESKEAIGGYYIVDCDEESAIDIAARIPVESRSWVQVRPIALFHPNVARISQMKDLRRFDMLYMFLLYHDPALAQPPDVMERHFAVLHESKARGAYRTSEAIGDTEGATTVRIRAGKTSIIDGPFAKTKEVLGGFYLLDCKDLDEALEYAAKIPHALNGAVEVRVVRGVPDWDYAMAGERAPFV